VLDSDSNLQYRKWHVIDEILYTAEVLREKLAQFKERDVFLGHGGGDDFAIICEPEISETLTQEIIRRFDAAAASFYDLADVQQGGIAAKDRDGNSRLFPIVTMSIGIASTEKQGVQSTDELSAVASAMKTLAKRRTGSTYEI
jgi:GGDEF domain-containing protein